ncbi:uncharacterized protein LY89DRAFT_451145 [Mollisia scopiformis]|uniref:Uncharacterized protein n=1 Tax=Mollisia scopiformis TaxID=149040 RepID=A0A194XKH1_MOLSC|nr:uncharacterized protein LY89DRAFT_451145 [Mollisia scopiformis]KUJ20658.1 hypothetical protein LY89DRAFT_451145 [Mollisia scopiformis]
MVSSPDVHLFSLDKRHLFVQYCTREFKSLNKYYLGIYCKLMSGRKRGSHGYISILFLILCVHQDVLNWTMLLKYVGSDFVDHEQLHPYHATQIRRHQIRPLHTSSFPINNRTNTSNSRAFLAIL